MTSFPFVKIRITLVTNSCNEGDSSFMRGLTRLPFAPVCIGI